MKIKRNTTSITGWRWLQLCLVPILVICFSPAACAEGSTTRYSHATLLKIRANAATDAAVVGKWPINQAMILLDQHDKRWCEVELPDASQRGFVACSFLYEEPLTLEQIEMEAAKEVLAFNRATLRTGSDYYNHSIPNTQGLYKSFDALFTLLDRHFAISPSLYTYADYNRLLLVLQSAPPEMSNLANSRLGQLAAMRDALSQDFTTRNLPPVRHAIGERLDLLLQQRRFGDAVQKAEPQGAGAETSLSRGIAQPAEKASFFTGKKWAAGWAGGGMVSRMRVRESEGFVYSVGFDGTGPWALADVYEMAKSLRVPVKATFSKMEAEDSSLSVMLDTSGRGPETLILDLRMPIWAITAQGLVAGTVRRVSFGGDACTSGGKVPTAAEVVFSKPVKGIHGIFATNASIDPAKAVISVRNRTFLGPLDSDENTFTQRVDMSVDLDGDGVADLRTVVSNDSSVGSTSGNGFMHALARPGDGHFRRVAGWYANDVFMLQSNEDGWWRTLSRYDVVTCT